MSYWNQTPLFRLLPAFIAGILFAVFATQDSDILIFVSLVFILVLFTLLLFSQKRYRYHNRWHFGFILYALFFGLGWLVTILHTDNIRPGHYSHHTTESYFGLIDEPPVEKSKSIKASVVIKAIKENNNWIDAEGKVLVYFGKDSSSLSLRYGDVIAFNERLSEVQEPANPGQFNYKRFLRFHQVYHQVFLSENKWKLIASHQGNWLKDKSFQLRERLLDVFKENNISGQDYAVLSALLLGYEEEIDQQIINAYSASGALHVLSVSGLHVGIIFIALNMLLAFMDRKRHTKIIKSIIIVLFLWCYALLTGLSPSVLRSAAMLSFVVIGMVSERKTNMYNTLAASAFLLLVINPYLLMQVGFQLSYLAVLGIVFLYSKIFHLFYFKNWLFRQIWSISAVSIAAQLATFPLGLLYFHQFPNYFLFSNLLIIPLSTVIIYMGIVLLLISSWEIVSSFLGFVLGQLVHFLNWLVLKIEELPFALLQGISISILETYLIYTLIVLLLLYVLRKQTGLLIAALSLALILMTYNIVELQIQKRNRQLIVFNVPRQSAINFIDGTRSVFIADSSLINNEDQMLFCINHYWWEQGVKEIKHVSFNSVLAYDQLCIYKNLIQFDDRRILFADSLLQLPEHINLPSIDFLILSGNVKLNPEFVLKRVRPKQLIIDSATSHYKEQQWIKAAKRISVPFYSVLSQGAFVQHL